MVRQYIGARYVIKIYENSLDPRSAEWEANVNYEPITMVTYNNGSYLSKKEVPGHIGNPVSNPEYWIQTGFYNGQIAYIMAQLTEIEGEIKDFPIIFNNVDEMKSADMEADRVAMTLGYHSNGDGGSGVYQIKSSSTKIHETLENGLVAELKYDDSVNVLQCGAVGDGTTDDLSAFNKAIAGAKTIIINQDHDYKLSDSISIGDYQSLIGSGERAGGDQPLLDFSAGGIIVAGNWASVKNIGIRSVNTDSCITLGTSGNSCQSITIDNVFTYDGKYGIKTEASVAWLITISNVRINNAETGLHLEQFKPGCTLINVYCDHCSLYPLYSYASKFTAIACNFGFIDGCIINLVSGTYVTFIGCNFECDEKITHSMIHVRSEYARFITCTFRMLGSSTAATFAGYNGTIGIILEGCVYPPITGNEATQFFEKAQAHANRYGAFVIGHGCYSIPRETLYSADQPNLIDVDNGKDISFFGTTIDLSKLTAGQKLWSITQNKPCYFDGTNVVDYSGNIIA